MEDYEQVIDRLFRTGHAEGKTPSLETAHILNTQLNHPSAAYACIHVAGSNGKGSVTTKIAKVLELSGYRVGVYTSPHLFSFCERIAVNGVPISKEDVIRGMHRLFALADRLQPTFFELTTFLAMDYFREKKVDVAVIETGLGGRYDATNVLCPLLSIITSISLEHTHLLGTHIEQIAAEKAGIIKEGIPVVLGPKASVRTIYERAKHLHCPVFLSEKTSSYFDEVNTAVAELALEQLASHFTIGNEALQKGLLLRPPCRFEQIGRCIFDVAHNPDAISSLLKALQTSFPGSKFRFLVGFSKDKEYSRCLDLIAEVATHLHLVQAGSSRAAAPLELKSAMKNEDPRLCSCHFSIAEAVDVASLEAHAKGEILVVCGSFYIMAEAKAAFSYCGNEMILPSGLSSSVN